jgi:hypothetical protein
MASRLPCPDAEALAALALGEGEPEARRNLADHVIACPACAADFRLLSEMHDTAQRVERRRAWPWLPAAAAAAAVATFAVGLLVGRAGPPRDPGAGDLAARLAQAERARAERELAALRRELESATAPAVNVPIVDLEPGRARGTGEAEAELRIPAGASWVTAVLAVSGSPSGDEHALEIRDEAGRTVWSGGGLVRSRFGTFTVAIPSRLLPPGRYRILLSRTTREGAPRVVQTYRLFVRPEGP